MKPRCSAHWLRFAAIGLCSASALAGGPLQRAPNTTLRMPPSPPTFGYTSTNAFGNLTFTNPVAIVAPPGETNRLFIVGKNGAIYVITNLAAPTRSVFMDLSGRVTSTSSDSGGTGEQGLLGLAFHPGYATNRYFYVFYTGAATNYASGLHDILSRFQISAGNTNQGDANSEVRLISQYDRDPNHNAGDLHFGTDGCLYVSLGDEGAEYDGRTNAQRIDLNFFSAILRLDVDKRPGSLAPNPGTELATTTNYAVPPDNPFVGATTFDGNSVNPNQVRTEFWAVGLRNPWRWSFDPLTGVLFCGDVGQDVNEEVDVIAKGGNYGWADYEGTNSASVSGHDLPHLPALNPIPPIVTYAHSTGNKCVIGGVVYRGQRLPQLYGNYVFGDEVSDNIWIIPASQTNGSAGPPGPIITDSGANLSAFGVDPSNGDVLYACLNAVNNGVIKRIIYNNTTNGAPLPSTLADTGAFTNLTSLTGPLDALQPAPGIVAYDINVPFWSDNALKSRWFSVPNTNLTLRFDPQSNWSFPTGTVWIKHFNLELTNGAASSQIRLETRLLVKNATGVYGVTYRWGGSRTNATLVDAGGSDESFVINDGGTLRTQIWHYPGQLECQACHTPAAGFALGFRTEQLNKDTTYPGGTTNEIMALSDGGYFSAPVTDDVHTLLALAALTDPSASLEFRARSFLMANCSQCHQPNGSAQQAAWDARITTPTALAGLIYGPLANNLNDASNRVITPLLPSNSVLLTRMATRDLAGVNSIQMPPLDSNLADTQAVDVISQWILSLSNTFWIGASPDPQTVTPGGNASYTVTVLPTRDFTNRVTLSVTGLPAGVSPAFLPPSVTGSNTSTLTVTANASAPVGTRALTLSGFGSGVTNTDTVALIIVSNITSPGTLVWTATGGLSPNTNWSASVNWTNVTAGGHGPPRPFNDLLFTNTGAMASAAVPDNFVDDNFTIASLQYANNATPPNYHVTLIADGQTLTITNGLIVGTATDAGANTVVNAVMTGSNATLVLTNGTFAVTQGSGSDGAHQAVLDLSGLGTLNASVQRTAIAVCQTPLQTGNGGQRSSGIVYLAKTNVITATSIGVTNGIWVGWNDNQGNAGTGDQGSALFLGQNNAIFTDGLHVGTVKTLGCLLAFNPGGLNNPSASFRGIGGPASRVSLWGIGDTSMKNNSNQSASGTNDFSAGTVDALVDNMTIGVTTSGAGSGPATGNGTGTLTFSAGTIDVNDLTNGWSLGTSTAAGTDVGTGTVNVNGSAILRVNNVLALAQNTGTGTGVPSGALNINGGTAQVNQIVSGSGVSTVALSGGTLDLTNTAGTPGAALSAFDLTNSTLRLRFDAGALVTNIVANNLAAAGVNVIAIDAALNLGTSNRFPVIAYSALSGSIAANIAVTNAPDGYLATLSDNSSNRTVDLTLVAAPASAPRFTGIELLGTNLVFNGANGMTGGNFYVLASSNLLFPLSNWNPIATGLFNVDGSFLFTNALDANSPRRFFLLQLP